MKTAFDQIFEREYKKLNVEQKDAVDTIEGPVMVIAGPGTGKTTILSLRIANILRLTDTPPSGILAITYTDAGVKAMRQNLRKIIGSRADEVRVHTFHAFAESVISEFPEHFPALSRSKQMSEPEAMDVIRNIIKSKKFVTLRPFGDPELYVDKILSNISNAKREAWTPEMIGEFATTEIKRIQNDEESISTRGASKGKLKADALKRIEKCEKTILFAEVYSLYEAQKRKDKKRDYDDLIFELVLALKNDELLLRLIQEKFLYILVDEHQDTNDSQNLIIRTIADFFENPNLFVVGDEKQAVYRFQGASVENFLKFQNIWPSMKVISLKDNYRSHQSILDASFSMIEENYADGEHENLRIPLKSGKKSSGKSASKSGGKIDVVSAGNNEAAEQYLINELKSIEKSNFENEPKSVAVIVRRNKDAHRVANVLRSAGIKASAERGSDIFSHQIGILFFELISYIGDVSLSSSLAKTLAGGLWQSQLSFSERVSLIAKIKAGDISAITENLSVINEINKSASKLGPIEFIINLATLSGLSEMASKDPLAVEVWRAIVALCQDLSVKSSIEDPRKLIEELINYKLGAESKNVRISVGDPDCNIQVMTAHRSKGLEFDYVYIMYAVEESWMSGSHKSFFVMPKEGDDGDSVRDSRRLFYVALTRAKEHAVIISSLEGEDARGLTPLRFINELDQNHVSNIIAPALRERGLKPVSSTTVNSGKNKHVEINNHAEIKEKAEYANRALMDRGLSVTALNHFIKCPNTFYVKSILRLPEPPTPSSEKGTAVHEAIDLVWKSMKNVDEIEKILLEGTSDYLKRSLLNVSDKERIKEDLLKEIPLMSKALIGHFSEPFEQSAVVSTEKWIETGIMVGDKTISLHGKLDAVIETSNEVKVFDYKTGKARTEASVKGETKDSDGDYFRQLVFYTILIASQEKYKNKRISTSLMFVKPDDKGRCVTMTLPVNNKDIEKVKSEIGQLVESIKTGKIASGRCDDSDCEYCALMSSSFCLE